MCVSTYQHTIERMTTTGEKKSNKQSVMSMSMQMSMQMKMQMQMQMKMLHPQQHCLFMNVISAYLFSSFIRLLCSILCHM